VVAPPDGREHEPDERQQPQRLGRSQPLQRREAHEQAARDAARDVRRLQRAHLAPARADLVVHRALQDREREAHEHRGQREQEERQQHIQVHHGRELVDVSEAEEAVGAPVFDQPGVEGRRGRQAREGDDGQARDEQDRALTQQERRERSAQAGDPWHREQTTRGRAEQVGPEHGAEGERGRLHRHVHQPEPHDLERERHEARERVERQPQAEWVLHASLRLGPGHDGRPGLRRAGRAREHERAQTGEHVPGGRDRHGAGDSAPRDQQPGSGEGAERGSEHVDPVEVADGAPGRADVAQHRAHEQRQRHAHQQRRGQQGDEMREPARQRGARQARRQRVEPVVVEERARRSEAADRELDESEEAQRRHRAGP
jgi:hypothetical protein